MVCIVATFPTKVHTTQFAAKCCHLSTLLHKVPLALLAEMARFHVGIFMACFNSWYKIGWGPHLLFLDENSPISPHATSFLKSRWILCHVQRIQRVATNNPKYQRNFANKHVLIFTPWKQAGVWETFALTRPYILPTCHFFSEVKVNFVPCSKNTEGCHKQSKISEKLC